MTDTRDTPPGPNSRRRFLFSTIAALPAASTLGACNMQSGSTATQPTSADAAAAPHLPRFFNHEEWSTLQAAVDRLIPKDAEGPGALELDVPVFIDRQMEGAFGHAATWYMQGPFHPEASPLSGYQSPMTPRDLYRAGIAALDVYCKANFGSKRFMDLSPADQDKVLHGMDAGTIKFEHASARSFITLLWQNTKEGYFADPIHGGNRNGASWTMIGFPGARADYLDWVSQPGKVYPLGTVTIERT